MRHHWPAPRSSSTQKKLSRFEGCSNNWQMIELLSKSLHQSKRWHREENPYMHNYPPSPRGGSCEIRVTRTCDGWSLGNGGSSEGAFEQRGRGGRPSLQGPTRTNARNCRTVKRRCMMGSRQSRSRSTVADEVSVDLQFATSGASFDPSWPNTLLRDPFLEWDESRISCNHPEYREGILSNA